MGAGAGPCVVSLCAAVAFACSSPPPPPSGPDPATCVLSGQTAITCNKNSDCCTDLCTDNGLGDGRKACQCVLSGGTCAQTNDCCQLTDTCFGYTKTTLGKCQ